MVEYIKRQCESCTKCCEGWLSGTVNGHEMYPGKPCFFIEINKGCKIYQDRPIDPCRNFSCSWIEIKEMPESFKPDKTGVIMKFVNDKNNSHFSIHKAPNNPSAEYIYWAIQFTQSINANLIWYHGDSARWIGTESFSKQMEESHKKCEDCNNFHSKWNWSIDDIDKDLLKITYK